MLGILPARTARLVERCVDHRWQLATLFGVRRALRARLEKHCLVSGVHQSPRDVTVAAADIQDEAARRKSPYRSGDASVAMVEPERVVLDEKASGVVIGRVRNLSRDVGMPDPAIRIETQDVAE